MSSEKLRKLIKNSSQYHFRGTLVKIYDLVLEVIKEHPGLSVGQLAILMHRHGIYGPTFKRMLESFVLNGEITIEGDGDSAIVRVVESNDSEEEHES